MQIVQRLILYAMGLALIAGGIAVLLFQPHTIYNVAYELAVHQAGVKGEIWRYAVAGGFVLIGLVAILPLLGIGGGRRKISFQGPHGPITIQLDSIEASLRKILGKVPSVKKVRVQLLPVEKGRKVTVVAAVNLTKASGASTCESGSRLSADILRNAQQLLGVNEVTGVTLSIDGLDVDAKSFVDPISAPIPEVALPTTPVHEPYAPVVETRRAESLPSFMDAPKPAPPVVEAPKYTPMPKFDEEDEPSLKIDDGNEHHEDTSFGSLTTSDTSAEHSTEKHED